MIIFLYGKDSYRSKEKLLELIKKFKEKRDKRGLSITRLEGEKLTIDEFRKAVFSGGLFSEKRLIIIENLLSKNKNQELMEKIFELLKEKKVKENVIIFYESEEVKENSINKKLFNFLKRQKYTQKFDLLEKGRLKNWIQKEVEKRGGKISQQAAELLTEYFDYELWNLSNEIDKLLAYGRGKIEVKTLEIISEEKKEEEIFTLIDALVNKDKKKAIKLLESNLAKGVPFSYLLSLLAKQFRIIFLLKEKGGTINYYRIAEEFNLHPFLVKKAIQQMKKYDLEELKKIYRELIKIDFQLKTTYLEPEVLFDLFIAKF